MKGLFQGKPMQPEGDLWDHTMLVLSLLPSDPTFTLAFAAFLHDVGKPSTRMYQYGRYTFHNHEQEGAAIADQVGRRLKLSNSERERITWLVRFHQYLGEAKRLREAKLKRMLAEPGIEELLALHRADALASTGDLQQVDYCLDYLENQPTGPDQPAAAPDRPRPRPARAQAGSAVQASCWIGSAKLQLDGQDPEQARGAGVGRAAARGGTPSRLRRPAWPVAGSPRPEIAGRAVRA